MSLNLIVSRNLCDADIANRIAEKLSGKRYLHLCATKDIMNNRSRNYALYAEYKPYTTGAESFNIATIADFRSFLQREAFKYNKCIRVSDERFILNKIISRIFEEGPKKSVFHSMRFQLYELYQFLMFHDICLDDNITERIGADYTEFERDVFALYSIFYRAISSLSAGAPDESAAQYLDGIDFSGKGYVTVRNRIKDVLGSFIDALDVIVLDGFLFFNELQESLIEYAIKRGKDVYLTAKYSGEHSYLFDYVYPALFKSLKQEYTFPLNANTSVDTSTALRYSKSAYGNFTLTAPPKELLHDKSIQFIKPFPNREMEWRYIAEQISRLLRENCGSDVDKLQSVLKNDIAVVLAHYGYNEQLASIFREIGLFIFTGEHTLEGLTDKVAKTFGDVYFYRADFLSENIRYENGTELSYAEKVKVFDKSFKGIKIRTAKPSITAYPVGQYVFMIYDILLNGISINTFKVLLYSNWQHNVYADALVWDKYLSDFKTLEVFFQGKSELDEWIAVAQNMLHCKNGTDDDYLLKYHPVAIVSKDSLSFFVEILAFIKDVVTKVGAVNGPIAEHLSMLKNTVMQVDKFSCPEDASFEQLIIKELIDAIDTVTGSALIKSVPATYFAENFHAMLSDYEYAVEEDDEDAVMFLNLVTLENITPYKYCFFPMMEAGKYPRKHTESFPFSTEFVEILKNPEYGICLVPSEYKELSAHIALENNLFQNVLDFTVKRLIFTLTQKEDEHKNYLSHYAHDIASLFDSDIVWTEPQIGSSTAGAVFEKRKPTVRRLPLKERYALKDLVTYKLCPRLYFHNQQNETAYTSKFQLQFYFIAVLFSATLNDFKAYNFANKKVYRTNDNEAAETALSIFDSVFKRYLPLFSIFTNYELTDIRATVQRKIQGFFADIGDKGVKGDVFTVVGIPESLIHEANGYDLVLEYDTKIFDMENRTNRISQNDIFLDFLVLKTSDDEGASLKHYAEMLIALDKNRRNCDRVNLIFKMMGKINIQFDSKRFAKDGITRTNALVEEISHADFSYSKPYASKFCQYCRVSDICKERAVAR